MPRTEGPRRPRPPWLHPALVILFVTGCFHLYRGAPLDGVVFLAVCLGVAVTEVRSPAPPVTRLTSIPGGRGRAVLVAAAIAAVLTVSPRYGDVDVLVVGLLGIGAVVLAVTRGDREPPPRRGRAWPYAVAGLMAALNELAAYFLGAAPARAHAHPAMSDLMNPLLDRPLARLLLVGCWLIAGVGMLSLMPARSPATEPLEAPVEPGMEEPE